MFGPKPNASSTTSLVCTPSLVLVPSSVRNNARGLPQAPRTPILVAWGGFVQPRCLKTRQKEDIGVAILRAGGRGCGDRRPQGGGRGLDKDRRFEVGCFTQPW